MPEDTEETGDDPGRLRRMYEESSTQKAAAEAELAQLRAERAFEKAGLDLNNPLHKVVANSYTGDLEKVKDYVDVMGLNKPAETTPPPEVPAAEREALERIERAGAGDGVPATSPDRVEQLKKELAEAGRRNNMQELDRISIELARAQGNPIRGQ